MCKPFDLDLNHIYLKYKPYRMKEKVSFIEDDLKVKEDGSNLLADLDEEEVKKAATVEIQEEEELPVEEKYYRFFTYMTVLVMVLELSIVYSKFNFLGVPILINS